MTHHMKTVEKMNYGSVCSGIEAATVAWEPLGWEAQWYSEIEKFPSAVLAHRFPTTPNLGDMTRIHDTERFRTHPINLLVGGTPCQSFSIAGLRKGLDDPRGNLALAFLRLADVARPRWIVWENVPGVLSSNRGRDFGTFLTALGQIGYGWAYRVLDAQYFGVPQRRRRVFVVGHLGDWRPAAAVLFEQSCLRGNPPPSREAQEGSAEGPGKCLTGRGAGGLNADPETANNLPSLLTMRDGKPGGGKGPLVAKDKDLSLATNNNQVLFQPTITDMRGNGDGKVSPTLSRSAAGDRPNDYAPMVMVPKAEYLGNAEGGALDVPYLTRQNISVGVSNQMPLVGDMAVRRLTPRECERLQGFPDDWTQVPYRGKPAADGPRYKSIGNSMAVPVMRWIGQRIAEVDA